MFGWVSKLGVQGRHSSRPKDNKAHHSGIFLLLRVEPCLVSFLALVNAAYYLAVGQDTDTVAKDLLWPSALAVSPLSLTHRDLAPNRRHRDVAPGCCRLRPDSAHHLSAPPSQATCLLGNGGLGPSGCCPGHLSLGVHLHIQPR